jgi:methionyl-tRNA synthetase
MREIAGHRALELIWDVCGDANRYVDAQAPWSLRKTDPARMATVLWVLAETLRHLAILTQPFMPSSSAKLLDLLAVPESDRGFAALGPDGAKLVPGTPLPAPSGVFPRYAEPEAA